MIQNVKRGHVRSAGLWAARRSGPGLRRRPGLLSRAIVVLAGLLAAMAVLGVGSATALATRGDVVWTTVVLTSAVAVAVHPVLRRCQRWLLRRADPRRQIAVDLAARYLRRVLADSPYDPSAETAGQLAQDAIRAALDDPRAQLILALPGARGWVDVDGRPVTGPSERHRGHVELVAGVGGQVMAYILYGSDTEPDQTGAAGVIDELRVLIERAVFRATVRDQAERIVAERERADRAALAERVRLERDLHDGVQGRLVALALNLQLARQAVGDPATEALLRDSVGDLRVALDDLRGLAAGRAPDLLVRSGLAAAVGDLASKLPRPVQVEVADVRLAPETEAAAYFVVAEALTNAVKHARASDIRARVCAEPAVLRIEVTDDGRGSADPDGAGLRGIAARVALAGGVFAVGDRPGGGTAVRVELPLPPVGGGAGRPPA
ncbi:signal transduction histidine kinase [Allocatelliglobosispora scoriae]|uniref:histidine kinase n=1 Tax=Allocatelliglobosispora scoriae TaxID=643052 RepID=A0A841BEI2_9ACTN|nr:ATP-binding protein [Allocatelliglobosispora scoriae]MBB5867497.1 signal transduction histidine kinase [Allocatelliglobosispora scoriae]